jgi:hypothetical protein
MNRQSFPCLVLLCIPNDSQKFPNILNSLFSAFLTKAKNFPTFSILWEQDGEGGARKKRDEWKFCKNLWAYKESDYLEDP